MGWQSNLKREIPVFKSLFSFNVLQFLFSGTCRCFPTLIKSSSVMSTLQKLAQFGQRHIAKGIGRSTELVIEKGKGAYVFTTEGKKYLDFTSGIGVTNTGK